MKKIDKYLLNDFLKTFIFTISLILLISIVFDISEKIDDFVSNKAPLKKIILDYYTNFVVYYGLIFTPLFTFISIILSISKLANNSEIISIINSGFSLKRILLPYIYGGILISMFSFFFNNFILPKTNEIRINFENKYFTNKNYKRKNYININLTQNENIFIQSFNVKKLKGYNFSHKIFDDNKLIYTLNSDFIEWNDVDKNWMIKNYKIYEIRETGEKISVGKLINKKFNFSINDIISSKNSTKEMNIIELHKFISKQNKIGSSNINYFLIDLYERYFSVLSTFILIIIGFSLSIHKKMEGIGINIVYGFIMTTIFILIQKIFISFTIKSNLYPFLSIIIPNLIFGVLAIILFKKKQV